MNLIGTSPPIHQIASDLSDEYDEDELKQRGKLVTAIWGRAILIDALDLALGQMSYEIACLEAQRAAIQKAFAPLMDEVLRKYPDAIIDFVCAWCGVWCRVEQTQRDDSGREIGRSEVRLANQERE